MPVVKCKQPQPIGRLLALRNTQKNLFFSGFSERTTAVAFPTPAIQICDNAQGCQCRFTICFAGCAIQLTTQINYGVGSSTAPKRKQVVAFQATTCSTQDCTSADQEPHCYGRFPTNEPAGSAIPASSLLWRLFLQGTPSLKDF